MVNHRSNNITLQWDVHFLIWQAKASQHPVDGSQLLRSNWKTSDISLTTLHHLNENKATQASEAKPSDQNESSSERFCLLRRVGTPVFHKMLHRSWCSAYPIKVDSKWGGFVCGPAVKLGSRDSPVATLGKIPPVSAYLLLVSGWSCSFVLVGF